MDHDEVEDESGVTFDWACVGCGENLLEAGIYQRCDTIVDYEILFMDGRDGMYAAFGESDCGCDGEDNCNFHCSACREVITTEQADELAAMM